MPDRPRAFMTCAPMALKSPWSESAAFALLPGISGDQRRQCPRNGLERA